MQISITVSIDDTLVKYFIDNNFGGEKFDDVIHLVSAQCTIEMKKALLQGFIDKMNEAGLRFPNEDEIH
jgi:hypothetical protein